MRQTRRLPCLSSHIFYFSSLKILRNFGISEILAGQPGLASSDFRPWLRACSGIWICFKVKSDLGHGCLSLQHAQTSHKSVEQLNQVSRHTHMKENRPYGIFWKMALQLALKVCTCIICRRIYRYMYNTPTCGE